MPSKELKLLALLRNIWQRTIGLTKLEVFKILKSDINEYNSTTVNQLLQQAQVGISKVHEDLTIVRAGKILGVKINLSTPNLAPLRALLVERRFLLNKVFSRYKTMLDDAANQMLILKKTQEYSDFIRIGRRGQDRIRQLTIKSIERTFLTGKPVTLGKLEIIYSILKDNSIKKITQLDGTVRFPLWLSPYDTGSAAKFANWDVELYAEMTARTTAQLADQEAFITDADETEETKSGFIKFNDTGKSSGQYLAENDPRCARINNAIFSTKPVTSQNGIRGAFGDSGRFYQYVRDVLTRFAIGHPNCQHIGKPIPAEVV